MLRSILKAGCVAVALLVIAGSSSQVFAQHHHGGSHHSGGSSHHHHHHGGGSYFGGFYGGYGGIGLSFGSGCSYPSYGYGTNVFVTPQVVTSDLLVMWNNDQPLEAVESSRVGRIENRERGNRSCHTPYGVIYACGPAIASGDPLAGAHVIDIAPTALQILGIAPPPALDGRVIPNLLETNGCPKNLVGISEERAA